MKKKTFHKYLEKQLDCNATNFTSVAARSARLLANYLAIELVPNIFSLSLQWKSGNILADVVQDYWQTIWL